MPDEMNNEEFFYDIIKRLITDEIGYLYFSDNYSHNDIAVNRLRREEFISNKLFQSAQDCVYKIIKQNNDIDINRFFSISLNQINTQVPGNLPNEILAIYFNNSTTDNERCTTIDGYPEITEYVDCYLVHSQKYVELIKSLNNDFKLGIITHSKSHSNLTLLSSNNIIYNNFELFLSYFYNGIKNDLSPLKYIYTVSKIVNQFKKEILTNLVTLSKDNRKQYLNRIKLDIQQIEKTPLVSKEVIDNWFLEYHIQSIHTVGDDPRNCSLATYLSADLENLERSFTEMFEEVILIWHNFYDYYYNFFIDEIQSFIDNNYSEFNVSNYSDITDNQLNIDLHTKLKTNLTVPQLAYLFKMLMDIHPCIFEVKSNADIYRFISANFTTKGNSITISVNSLSDKYSNVDKATADFWLPHLQKMKENARKI